MLISSVVMFQNQNRETVNNNWKVAVTFNIIMTTSVTRPCFSTQQDQDQDRLFWSQTGLVLRPMVSDHVTSIIGSFGVVKEFIDDGDDHSRNTILRYFPFIRQVCLFFCLCAFICLSVCLVVGRWQISMNFYGELGYLTSNSWLDFGDDLDNSVDTGIFKRNSYQCRMWQF